MGNPQKDDTKRFFLLKGLNAEYERNCFCTIISYESRDGLSGANYDKAVKILSDWADGHKLTNLVAVSRKDFANLVSNAGICMLTHLVGRRKLQSSGELLPTP